MGTLPESVVPTVTTIAVWADIVNSLLAMLFPILRNVGTVQYLSEKCLV